LTILPKLGGKIASIRMNEHELLQAPLAPYGPRTRTMSFDAGDASGWDECLPSVAGCTVQTVNGHADVPDHGDLWRVEWQCSPTPTVPSPCEAIASRCLWRWLHRIPDGDEKGYRLHADYQVTNTGSRETPGAGRRIPVTRRKRAML